MKETASKSIAAKLKKLALLARQLRGGEDFQTTRLTVLKSWCEDPIAAGRFTLHLAERSKDRATKKYKPLIANALRQLKKHLASRTRQAPAPLGEALQELEDSQNETRDTRWGRVRTIHCREALLAEHALRCVARPQESAHWGYQAARQSAERYNPRYGTGLIPESASAVEDIVAFWGREHFGKRCHEGARRIVTVSTSCGRRHALGRGSQAGDRSVATQSSATILPGSGSRIRREPPAPVSWRLAGRRHAAKRLETNPKASKPLETA